MRQRNSEEWQIFVKQQAIFHVSRHVLHEVGHFPGVTDGARNVFVLFVFLTEGTSMCVIDNPRENTHMCVFQDWKRTTVMAEQDHRRGNQSQVVLLQYVLLGKQVPFLQRLYRCLPLWIAFFFFLLPLVSKWTENCQTGSFVLNLLDRLLWGQFCYSGTQGNGTGRLIVM